MIRPHEVEGFLAPLPVARIPGVGKVMDTKLAGLGIRTCADLRARDVRELEQRFGRYGRRLAELAVGIDERAVTPDQPVQSISTEDTLAHDLTLAELEPLIRALAARTWAASRKTARVGRTVVLKLKTADFRILTRSHTPPAPPQAESEFVEIAVSLRTRVDLPARTRYRLVGIGLGNFRDADDVEAQAELFS